MKRLLVMLRRFWAWLWRWGKEAHEQAEARAPLPATPRLPMHFAQAADLPLCGASTRGALWTAELPFVTCPECRRVGTAMALSYDMNTR